jgi:hypothetical protein
MKFDGRAYELGYWSARSGQPGLAMSASMRVGFQHGAVDRALDAPVDTLPPETRRHLCALSWTHETWRRAARAGNREAQANADSLSRKISDRLTDPAALESLQAVSPALHSRLKMAPGIQLVI